MDTLTGFSRSASKSSAFSFASAGYSEEQREALCDWLKDKIDELNEPAPAEKVTGLICGYRLCLVKVEYASSEKALIGAIEEELKELQEDIEARSDDKRDDVQGAYDACQNFLDYLNDSNKKTETSEKTLTEPSANPSQGKTDEKEMSGKSSVIECAEALSELQNKYGETVLKDAWSWFSMQQMMKN